MPLSRNARNTYRRNGTAVRSVSFYATHCRLSERVSVLSIALASALRFCIIDHLRSYSLFVLPLLNKLSPLFLRSLVHGRYHVGCVGCCAFLLRGVNAPFLPRRLSAVWTISKLRGNISYQGSTDAPLHSL